MLKRWTVVALCLLILNITGVSFASEAVPLWLEGTTKSGPEAERFLEMHPDIQLETNGNIFLTTDTMLRQMIARDFNYDGFRMQSATMHIGKFIEKGYCMDLSGYADLTAEVENMLPSLQKMMQRDGKTYAVPLDAQIQYFAYQPDAWEAAGLVLSEVPDTFEKFLDFLDHWADRVAETEDYSIVVLDGFDEAYYGPGSYTRVLTRMLIENYIMYADFYGEKLKFDTEIFERLLEKCEMVGNKLYQTEVFGEGEYTLFWDAHGIQSLGEIVPLRIREEQETVVRGTCDAYAIYPTTANADLTADYIRVCISCMSDYERAFLYKQAHAVRDEDIAKEISECNAEIEEMETYLETNRDSLSGESIQAYQESIEEKKNEKEKLENSAERWEITDEEIRVYQSYGDRLYFQEPNIFDPTTEDGQKVFHYVDLFCNGRIDVKQLIERLDELAWMLATENE